MIVLGVDPGASGAVAWLDNDGTLKAVVDMPHLDGTVSGALLRDLIAQISHDAGGWPVHAAVEKVAAMPRQGVSSTFKFGTAYGTVLGCLGALSIPMTHVSAAKWKRALGLTSDKNASRARAVYLWPTFAGEFKRVKDDGRAEAALIAEWWRRQQ